ncbi:hypothetical protein C8J57DRAFT_1256027 [Mycena rebaudengoi]|nr:hypothetical protein C8J57DRAFT_1256027 [Mycena rebaudengoi]
MFAVRSGKATPNPRVHARVTARRCSGQSVPANGQEEKGLGRAEIVEFSLQILLRPAVPARRSSTSDSLHVEVNELSDLLGNSEPLLYQSDPELMPHLGLIPAAGKHSGFFKIYKYIDYKICHGAFELLFYHFEKIGMRDIRQPSDFTRRITGIIGIEVLFVSFIWKNSRIFSLPFCPLTTTLSRERGASHYYHATGVRRKPSCGIEYPKE